MQKTYREENSQHGQDEDHVVVRVEARETRIAVGDSADSCLASSEGQTRETEFLLQSLTGYYLFYLVGGTSLFIPFITGQGALHMLPWLLNLSGFLSLLQYACVRKAPGSTAIFFLAAFHLTSGLWMLRKPAVGQTEMTYLIEVWFLIQGGLKLLISLHVRKLTAWRALFASGLFSVVLACVLHCLPPNLGLPPADMYIRLELFFTGCAGALLFHSVISLICL